MASTADRGYGVEHQKLRAYWKPRVEAGTVDCWRCEKPIAADAPWDLGHDDHDRTKYRGPEHRGECNRRAGGAQGAAKANAIRSMTVREW